MTETQASLLFTNHRLSFEKSDKDWSQLEEENAALREQLEIVQCETRKQIANLTQRNESLDRSVDDMNKELLMKEEECRHLKAQLKRLAHDKVLALRERAAEGRLQRHFDSNAENVQPSMRSLNIQQEPVITEKPPACPLVRIAIVKPRETDAREELSTAPSVTRKSNNVKPISEQAVTSLSLEQRKSSFNAATIEVIDSSISQQNSSKLDRAVDQLDLTWSRYDYAMSIFAFPWAVSYFAQQTVRGTLRFITSGALLHMRYPFKKGDSSTC